MLPAWVKVTKSSLNEIKNKVTEEKKKLKKILQIKDKLN